eukprot:8173012-Pyramimonas_sp.AAC.1
MWKPSSINTTTPWSLGGCVLTNNPKRVKPCRQGFPGGPRIRKRDRGSARSSSDPRASLPSL